MRRPRLTLCGALMLIASLAMLLAVARLLGPRPGVYSGRYWYIDASWPYCHDLRGTSIIVVEGGGWVVANG